MIEPGNRGRATPRPPPDVETPLWATLSIYTASRQGSRMTLILSATLHASPKAFFPSKT